MMWQGYVQIALLIGVVVACVKPLGSYMARVYEGQANTAQKVLGPVERLLYKLLRVDPTREMTWKSYALATLLFNFIGLLALYLLQRVQGVLPANPQGFAGVSPDSSFNTAVSFVTNTNWQGYGGESTMSYLTQMMGMTVQNVLSGATGMAVLVALIRGFSRKSTGTIGNFWFDLVRSTLYVLLPLSVIVALLLVSQGVVQNLSPYLTAHLLQSTVDADGKAVTDQVLALGPAASQTAIKMLGTNGGGFFNANSAHPFENPTGFSNLIEIGAIFLIPAALTHTFGKMVGDTRQGWAIFAAMSAIALTLLVVVVSAEQAGNPALFGLPVDQTASALHSGGNMEGKEARFGISGTGLFATVTTMISCGAVNSMHDSFTPLGGAVPMWLMQLGEVVFGGVGAGLYGMLMFALVAVFIAGLMVGRTPEYLGKKIEAFEMKMASLVILTPCAAVLLGTALAVATDAGRQGVANPGAHGFSEILYALSSASNNNGSAFAGLSANTVFYNTLTGIAMLMGRFGIIVPVLAAAGALAKKKLVASSAGTLPTHTPLFVTMLIGIVLVVGALTFIPALALGPFVEHLLANAR